MKILSFATSPRRHGNSEIILDKVLEMMQSNPTVSVEKIALSDLNLNPCRGCNACERLNRCVIRDDMDILHDKLIEADCIIFASPVYCMTVCAQAKVLIDRCQVFRSRKYVLKLPVIPPERKGKRLGLFISTAGQGWDYVFDAVIPPIKCFFHVIGIRESDIFYLLINGVDQKGAVLDHPTALPDSTRVASELLSELRRRLSA